MFNSHATFINPNSTAFFPPFLNVLIKKLIACAGCCFWKHLFVLEVSTLKPPVTCDAEYCPCLSVALKHLNWTCPEAAISVWLLLTKRNLRSTWNAGLHLQLGRRGTESSTPSPSCGFLSNYMPLIVKMKDWLLQEETLFITFKSYFVVKIVKSAKPGADRGKFMVHTLGKINVYSGKKR